MFSGGRKALLREREEAEEQKVQKTQEEQEAHEQEAKRLLSEQLKKLKDEENIKNEIKIYNQKIDKLKNEIFEFELNLLKNEKLIENKITIIKSIENEHSNFIKNKDVIIKYKFLNNEKLNKEYLKLKQEYSELFSKLKVKTKDILKNEIIDIINKSVITEENKKIYINDINNKSFDKINANNLLTLLNSKNEDKIKKLFQISFQDEK